MTLGSFSSFYVIAAAITGEILSDSYSFAFFEITPRLLPLWKTG